MIAKDHHLYIVDVQEKGPIVDGRVTYHRAYVVYRENPVRGQRGIRLGRRTDPKALLQLVKTLAGINPQPTAA